MIDKIPTLYSNYNELLLDFNIYCKTASIPQLDISEKRDMLFEEFKRQNPLPTMELERYKLSNLISTDYKVTYEKQLELQENENLIDLENQSDSHSIDLDIDFESLEVPDNMQELFSYEEGITDSDRQAILEKFDLLSGEEFDLGNSKAEEVYNTVQHDDTSTLTDEQIQGMIDQDSSQPTEPESTSIEIDEGISVDIRDSDSDNTDLESDDDSDDSDLDSEIEYEEDDDDSEDDSDDSEVEEDLDSDDSEIEYEEEDSYDEEYEEDDSDDTEIEDDSDDKDIDPEPQVLQTPQVIQTVQSPQSSEPVQGIDDDSDEEEDTETEYEEEDSYDEEYEEEDSDDEEYEEEDNSDTEYEDDSDVEYEEEDEEDEYEDEDTEIEDEDEDTEIEDEDEDIEVEQPVIQTQSSSPQTASPSSQTQGISPQTSSQTQGITLKPEVTQVIQQSPSFVDSILDESTSEDDIEFIAEENRDKVIETPKIQLQPVQVQKEPEEKYTDLRQFLRAHPRCEYSEALKYFSDKEIKDMIRKGKVIKKGTTLRI